MAQNHLDENRLACTQNDNNRLQNNQCTSEGLKIYTKASVVNVFIAHRAFQDQPFPPVSSSSLVQNKLLDQRKLLLAID